MKKTIKVTLYKGMEINKDLTVNFIVTYETKDGQYPTIRETPSGYTFNRAYGLAISEGYDKSRMFCSANEWFQFVTLLHKSIKLIQENFYNIFPGNGRLDRSDIDTKELERFQTEKCMYLDGITIVPIIYMTDYDSFPGIRISTKRNEYIKIPFEDAIIISEMLDKIEPNILSVEYLKLLL